MFFRRACFDFKKLIVFSPCNLLQLNNFNNIEQKQTVIAAQHCQELKKTMTDKPSAETVTASTSTTVTMSSVTDKPSAQIPAGSASATATCVKPGPSASITANSAYEGEKRGHVCCGVCCDVRRACIILNVVFSIITIIGLILIGFTEGWVYFVFLATGLGFYLSGIYGAITFKWMMVLAALIYNGAFFVLNLVFLNWIGAVFMALIMYPHVFLVMELRNGIMSKQNFHIEDKCCCNA